MTLTTSELRALRGLLDRAGAPIAEPTTPDAGDFAPGDLAQLQPGSCSTFGGMLLQIGEVYSPYELRGWFLRPHRGGCREAWHRANPAELVRIGRVAWPDPEFSRRRSCYQVGRCPLIGR
jgi:hypothetical protein